MPVTTDRSKPTARDAIRESVHLVWEDPAQRAWRAYIEWPWRLVVWVFATLIVLTGVAEVLALAWRGPAWSEAVFFYSPNMPTALSLVVSVFAHRDLAHLAENLAGLFLIGVPLSRWVGWRTLAATFVAGGVAAAFLQGLVDPTPSNGASGAILAWFGLASVIWRSESTMWFWPNTMPFVAIASGAWEGAKFLRFRSDDGFGHLDHAAGIAAGLVLGVALRTFAALERRKRSAQP